MANPVWSKRNNVVKNFINDNASIVDFGCGNKDILNYITPKEYIGLDKNNYADVYIDFDIQSLSLEKKYDCGLMLGLLEYLDDPYGFVESAQCYADCMIILILPKKKKKSNWKQTLSHESTSLFLNRIYKEVNEHKFDRYVLFKCS